MITRETAERIALRLFPDDFHDGHNCRGEYGREGQPCRICADNIERWRDRVTAVLDAVNAELPPPMIGDGSDGTEETAAFLAAYGTPRKA